MTGILDPQDPPTSKPVSLGAFLVVIVICAILAMWIFGQTSNSNHTTTKTNEPSSSQSEDATTKPNTPSSENSKPATPAPETPAQTDKVTNQTPSNSSSTPSYGNICIHYEYGRCWDDLEDAAYDAGRWDGNYGSYGNSYYESDDCDDLCQDIMEDAYEEGYYDY